MVKALDNLLDTPAIKEPIKLIQPHVLYLFADPDLEERSIGQRILVRTGRNNQSQTVRDRAGIDTPHA